MRNLNVSEVSSVSGGDLPAVCDPYGMMAAGIGSAIAGAMTGGVLGLPGGPATVAAFAVAGAAVGGASAVAGMAIACAAALSAQNTEVYLTP